MNKDSLQIRISPFMNEYHPLNPYGYNYIEHPQQTKLYYKYNLIRKHVHISEDDEYKLMKEGAIIPAGVITALVFGLGTSMFIGKRILPKIFGDNSIQIGAFLNAFTGASSVAFSYFALSDRFVDVICIPFTEKYLSQAIKNGFENYEISSKDEFQNNTNL